MLTNSLPTNVASRFDRSVAQRPPASMLLSLDGGSRLDARQDRQALWQRETSVMDLVDVTVEVAPSDIVKRRTVAWPGMAAEIVQATRRERTEYRFRAPFHLLVVYEQGERRDGETFVEGLPRSTLRDFKRKLTFVPAGHEYREWQDPRILSRVVYFYFDPARDAG